jgi:hypothetical protein
VAGADESSPLSVERAEVLRDLARVQRELMRPDLSDDVRRERLARLEELEATEAVLRDRLAREDPVYRALRPPAPASIADVQRLLGEDQALLAFRVTAHGHPSTRREEDALYAWVFVITHQGADVFPVPPGWELDSQVQVYLGLLEGRDGKEALAAGRLARDLLGRSLGSLPDDVRRLVIVPDRSLHRLPFGTLLSPEGEPLAERFEISYAPSATTWARWKKTPSESAGRATLAFADPELPAPSGASRERAADPWLEGLRLGRLPFARREASNALRQLGPGELRTGPDASEHFLKHVDLERIGILHFAAHAVVDEERPDRSSVILAPGSVEEDGLLQVREIVELDLEGRLVLLTGCRSAQGEAIAGEGAMSLAHAFFQSGARSVVGSFWSLRDDETALLVSLFAERIARGASVAAALAGAQREMIEAGAPPAAWGGLVVLGDGDVVPVPGGRLRLLPVFAGFAFATAGGMLGLVLWLRRRSSSEYQRASPVSRDA